MAKLSNYVHYSKTEYLEKYGNWQVPSWDLSRFQKGQQFTPKDLQNLSDIFNSDPAKAAYDAQNYKNIAGPISEQWRATLKDLIQKNLEGLSSKNIDGAKTIRYYSQNTESNETTTGGHAMQIYAQVQAIVKAFKGYDAWGSKDGAIKGVLRQLEKYENELGKMKNELDKRSSKKTKMNSNQLLKAAGVSGKAYTNYLDKIARLVNAILIATGAPAIGDEGGIFEMLGEELVKEKDFTIKNGLNEIISLLKPQGTGNNRVFRGKDTDSTRLDQGTGFLAAIEKYGKETFGVDKREYTKDFYGGEVIFRTTRSANTLDAVLQVNTSTRGTVTHHASIKNVKGVSQISLFSQAPLDTLLELEENVLVHFLNIWSKSTGAYKVGKSGEDNNAQITKKREEIKTKLLPYLFALRGMGGQKHGSDTFVDTLLIRDKTADGEKVQAFSSYDLAYKLSKGDNYKAIHFSDIPHIKNVWEKTTGNEKLDRAASLIRSVKTYLKLHSIKISPTLNLNQLMENK